MNSQSQSNRALVTQEIRQFIVDNFLFGDTSQDLDESDSFLGTNLIDSTGILELVQFVEERFGIIVDDSEMLPENLDSLSSISHFVVRKQAGEAT